MIKRIRLATRREGVDPSSFTSGWPGLVEAATAAPVGVRPVRVAIGVVVPEIDLPHRHDGIGTAWFDDIEHHRRFDRWLGESRIGGQVEGLLDPITSPVLVAEEVVVRGADWLEQRSSAGGEVLQHIALARRAGHLTAAEFSAGWRGHAGQVRSPGSAAPTVIPEEARGLAYVQNHPCPRPTGDWAYDAVNEVYFDDLDSLQQRVDWFRDNDVGADGDLFGASWFLAVRTTVIG